MRPHIHLLAKLIWLCQLDKPRASQTNHPKVQLRTSDAHQLYIDKSLALVALTVPFAGESPW